MRPGDFEVMASPHYPGLVQRLTLVLRNEEDARDVAQDAYLRAWDAWDRFDGTDARAWLYTIALRLAFNHRRGRARLAAFLRRESPEEPAWVPVDRLDLWAALGRLRREERAVLLMNVLDGYTQREIAGLLQVPPGTVAGWIAGAKRSLRGLLHDPHGEASA